MSFCLFICSLRKLLPYLMNKMYIYCVARSLCDIWVLVVIGSMNKVPDCPNPSRILAANPSYTQALPSGPLSRLRLLLLLLMVTSQLSSCRRHPLAPVCPPRPSVQSLVAGRSTQSRAPNRVIFCLFWLPWQPPRYNRRCSYTPRCRCWSCAQKVR